jgi:hypothetical protein
MAGRTEWSNGRNGGNGGRTEWSNGGNGRMAEMATYLLFTVHTDNTDTDDNNDNDDTLIFYSIETSKKHSCKRNVSGRAMCSCVKQQQATTVEAIANNSNRIAESTLEFKILIEL